MYIPCVLLQSQRATNGVRNWILKCLVSKNTYSVPIQRYLSNYPALYLKRYLHRDTYPGIRLKVYQIKHFKTYTISKFNWLRINDVPMKHQERDKAILKTSITVSKNKKLSELYNIDCFLGQKKSKKRKKEHNLKQNLDFKVILSEQIH